MGVSCLNTVRQEDDKKMSMFIMDSDDDDNNEDGEPVDSDENLNVESDDELAR